MKKLRKVLAVLLTLATVLSLSAGAFAANWTDVPKGSWYESYINTVVDAGIMNGVGENKFDPNGTLSRAMFVTILNRAAGNTDVASNTVFSDVVAGSWYDRPVQWAESQGVVNGYTDGRFGVNDPLTREQMFTILYRYFSANGKADAPADALDRFVDKDKVSAYAVDAYRWAVAQNIFYELEKNTLNPGTACSRGEAAAVIARFMEYADKNYTKLTRADLEAAVAELGIQFHLKNKKFQYDSIDLSRVFNRYYGGHYRLTEGAVPEYGTDDTTIYSVCSDYCYKSYFSALGYRIFGAETYSDSVTDSYWKHSEPNGMLLIRWVKDESVITSEDLKFGVTKESCKSIEELRAFIKDWKNTMRPGDILLPKGHALMYIGNGYVMDCGGGKYDMKTGVDMVEATGAVRYLHKIEELFLSDTGPYGASYFMNPEKLPKDYFCILRPINALVVDDGDGNPANDVVRSSIQALPDASESRLKYEGMEINRTVDITPYGSTFTGDTLTYNVGITNFSNQKNYMTWKQYENPSYKGIEYKGLVVTEKIPAGTTYVEGSATEGGVYKDGVITWTLNIPAGEVKNLTYKVTVTAKQGEEIVSTGGFVDRIPSNTIVNPVGGKKLSQSAIDGFKKFGQTDASKWREVYNVSALAPDTDFAERVYAKAAGIQLDLPTVQELVSGLLTPKTMINKSESVRYYGTKTGTGLTLRETVAPEYQMIKDMIVKDSLGGRNMYFADNGMTINEFKDNYMEVGDILVWADADKTGKVTQSTIIVQTGEKEIAVMASDGLAGTVSSTSYLSTLVRSLSQNVFFILRPSLAIADINAAKYDASKEPAYGEEPASNAEMVSAPLSEENIAKFKALQSETSWGKSTNTTFVENVYSKVGLNLKQFTNSTSIVNLMKVTFNTDVSDPTTTSKYQYVPMASLFMEPNNKAIMNMMVENYRGGADMVDDGNLIKTFKVSDLKVGDAIFMAKRQGSIYWVGIYLGDNKMIVNEYQKSAYNEYKMYDLTDESYSKLLSAYPRDNSAWEFFLLIRPSDGFKNINTGEKFDLGM